MSRYRLKIEYDGCRFCGWQRQEGAASVQQTIEEALKAFSGEVTTLHGAGRTDTGVHATGQVAHVDLVQSFSPYRVMSALNHFLRDQGVGIVAADLVDKNFHARFSATSRTYIYKILNRRTHSVIDQNRVWHVILPLNLDLMREGANYLVGHHDFASFRAIRCQAPSSIRTLDAFDLWQEDDYILARIQSKSFLHNQVRIMMGTLAEIGKKRWHPEIIKEMLQKKHRTAGGPTAPAHGLYLVQIDYPSPLVS